MLQELNYIRCGDYYIPDIRLPEKNKTYWSVGSNAQRLYQVEIILREMIYEEEAV